MYSGLQLCENLQPKQCCFRLQRYAEGRFSVIFHEHVPAYRFSLKSATEGIRALALRHDGLSDSEALRCYLNERGTNPRAVTLLHVYVEYPEPSVIRRQCGANVIAMVDEVIDAKEFRREPR